MYDLDIVLNSTMSVWANSCLCTLLQLDSATSLITAAKNLMNAVISTVKASYVANTKVDFMKDSQISPPPPPLPRKKIKKISNYILEILKNKQYSQGIVCRASI